MALDNRSQNNKENLNRTGHKGRLLFVLLCVLMVAGGAVLLYLDADRDYRHGIYRCADGRMMQEPAVPDENLISTLSARLQTVAESNPGMEQYVMLIPSASCIQSVYLPEGASVRDQKEDLNHTRAALPAGVTWIDLTELFTAHAGEKLYYATDVYLTGWGSRYAAKAALEGMGATVPDSKYKSYLLSDGFRGNLEQDGTLIQRLLRSKSERLEIYVPEEEAAYYRMDVAGKDWSGSLYDARAAEGPNAYDVFFGGERPLTEIHTAAANNRTILVVGDRMADSIVPHFVSSFEHIILMHPSSCSARVEKLIGKYKPEKILYLYDANTFFSDYALAGALPGRRKK